MKSLAVDTSTNALSLALFQDDQLVLDQTYQLSKQHGQTLIPLVNQLIKNAGWSHESINVLYIGRGPGSYTGMRIGATFAKTWAVAKSVQLYSFSSLVAMASQIIDNDAQALVLPIMNARRQSVYAGAYTWRDGYLQSMLEEGHFDFECWLKDQLLPLVNGKGYRRIYWVIDQAGDLIPLIYEHLKDWDGTYQIIEGSSALVTLQRLPFLPTSLVSDPNLFVPFYAHESLAEQEWAQKRSVELGTSEQESYVEQTDETDLS